MIVESEFLPSLWMRNPHVQSFLVGLPFRRRAVERFAQPLLTASEEHLLDCGNGVRLQAFFSRPATLGFAPVGKTAMLLHGWEGNSNTLYILSLAQKLFARGFDVVRVNLRDHGGTHHLNRELFHSGLLPEVVGAAPRQSGRAITETPTRLRMCQPNLTPYLGGREVHRIRGTHIISGGEPPLATEIEVAS